MLVEHKGNNRSIFPVLDVPSRELIENRWETDECKTDLMLVASRELKGQPGRHLWNFIRNKEKNLRCVSFEDGIRYSGTALFAYTQLAEVFQSHSFVPSQTVVKEVNNFTSDLSFDAYDLTYNLMCELSPEYLEGFKTILLSFPSEARAPIISAASDMWLVFFRHYHSQIGVPQFNFN